VLLLAAGQRDAALQQYQILRALSADVAGRLYQTLYRDQVVVVPKP
jgi:hypothetical protein